MTKKAGKAAWYVRRVAVDEPEEGESGTIYEYEVRDENDGIVFTTYEQDKAELVTKAVNAYCAAQPSEGGSK